MKKTLIAFIFAMIIVSTSLAAAVRFDVAQARQEEWDRYLEYREEYIRVNRLDPYRNYINERNLQRSFGFYGPEEYYIPPNVLAAKYNPPLQGEAYSTGNRGYTTSLQQPSAVKYDADKQGSRYTGYVRPDIQGTYFDHPQAQATVTRTTYGTVTQGYATGYGYAYPGSTYEGNPDLNDDGIRHYARIADRISEDYYIVGFY